MATMGIIMIAGCSSTDSSTGSYQSNKVYKQALYSEMAQNAMAYEGPARNPVIVIHGFLGARLQNVKTGENVWGDFRGIELLEGYSNKNLQEFSHPMGLNKPLKELKDNVTAVSLLSNFNVTIMGIKFNLDAYNKLIEILDNAGYVSESQPLPEGKNFYSQFTFYYDWRRDLSENSMRLHDFIQLRRTYLQGKYKKLYGIENYDVQFDIVSHSMGGLLSRYYMRYGDQDLPADGSLPKLNWSGSKYIDKLIVIATPNAGYLDTCLELVNGLKADPRMPVYPPAVIGTWPTYYQMLPLTSTRSVVYADDQNGKPVDVFDPQVWIDMNWGLADPKHDPTLKILLPNVKTAEERRKIALDHLTKCLKRAKQFTEAMREYGEPPDDVALVLFLGDAVETRRVAEVDRKTGKLTVTKFEAGDGKVLASSARMDEREGREWTPFVQSPIKWQAVIHLQDAHMGITESYSFSDNIAYYLTNFPTKKQEDRKEYLDYMAKNK